MVDLLITENILGEVYFDLKLHDEIPELTLKQTIAKHLRSFDMGAINRVLSSWLELEVIKRKTPGAPIFIFGEFGLKIIERVKKRKEAQEAFRKEMELRRSKKLEEVKDNY
jgi:hypothetical protein